MNKLDRREIATGIFTGLCGLAAATLFALGISDVVFGNDGMGVALIAGAALLRALSQWLHGLEIRVIRRRVTNSLDAKLLHMAAQHSEITVVRLDSAATAIRAGVGTTATAMCAATSLLGSAGVAVSGGWLAASVFLGLLVLAVPFYIRAGLAAERSRREVAVRLDDFARIQQATLEAMLDMRSLGTVPYAVDRITVASEAASVTVMESIRRAMGSSLVTDFLGGAGIGLVAMVVGFDLMNERRTLSAGFVALWLVIEMNSRIRQWAATFHQREDARLARDVLDTPTPPRERVSSLSAFVELRDITIPRCRTTITMSVQPGDRIIIEGPSGVGKTTLLRIMTGLQTPDNGTVVVGNIAIGYVQPASQLMATTIGDNLRIGAEVSDEEIHLVLRSLGLTGSRFENLESPIGSALQFSDGERARLAIARALIAKAPLLILDDIGGLFDDQTVSQVAKEFERHPAMAVVEAGHSRRLLTNAHQRITLEPA